MDLTTVSLAGLIALALLFDYTNGFHDAANAISTVVATRVLPPRWAVAWAAMFNLIAFTIFGTLVANTVAATVKEPYVSLAVIFAALLGAITWNYLSWYVGVPTSSSHALVGGLVGAGLAAAGTDAIRASSLQKTALFVVISPIAGLVVGYLLMALMRLVLARRDVARTERGFRVAQLASSAAISLGHGGNDAQKTMGVIAATLVATGHLEGGDHLDIPMWVVLAAHAAIAAGTLSGGWRLVRTMGMSITELRPVSGFAAETSAAAAIFASTAVGAPVSTTHTVAGAITGVGSANGGAPVNWSVFGRLAIAWIVTIPFSAGCAAAVYALTTIPVHPLAIGLVTTLLLALLGALWLALRNAPRASDISAELAAGPGGETAVPVRPGAGSVIVYGHEGVREEGRSASSRGTGRGPPL
ncbi:inorganic phosphate transporter, PiT family [Parafrankia irregularis]|uniref:Phosphate transporter n=1 Tax=Parafrankia irregularis TaxID=795642 RepID=A0A0S4QYW1_9ACTN|nr:MULTISPECIES: inorganic phosphate transporter [Parafrankia]MBE3204902.1 inorganic phosphate transporter [Parafrankia sp. CH37]CUU60675.1 inorganic phosphate transporter, PiT family [Parafrankia irregularis]